MHTVATDSLSAEQHEDLTRVNGACFEISFDADLREDQYRGALWVLSAVEEPAEVETVTDDLDDVLADAGVDVAAVRATATRWPELESGALLPGPVTRCYWVRLAM